MKEADIFEKVKNIEREIRELCDKRYRDGVNDGFDDGYNQGYFDAKGTKDDEISEQERKDAWECARKMVLSDEDGGIALSDIQKIFGMTPYSALLNFSASEAMAKIKEYEEKQKRTCDTCQYKGWTLENNKKCAKCYDNNGWTPKQTEKKCSDCKHYVTDGHTTFCSLSKVGGCCVNKDNWTPKKMTLDEAIKHCEEVADSKCDECGAEHRQLAEWLKDYKRLLEQEPKSEWQYDHEILKAYSDGANEVLDKIRAEIEALPKTYPFVNHFNTYVKEDDVRKIIDRYKVESEVQE